ncbi:Transcriptional regulator PadR-like family protein [Candidatus Tiddalikarchaeum anstoanum]|nr:Transcriptional regulator PadR-like family protein [Candidatus Tiddalikarchaeum anstoanum]
MDLKDMILKILSKSPKHGYQLAKELSVVLEKEISIGGMYPILKELEEKGLILGHDMVEFGRFKKVYKLTSKGRKEVEKVDKHFKLIKKIMES